jgi:pimeloyl-ACP methyl ester carboxylesterase
MSLTRLLLAAAAAALLPWPGAPAHAILLEPCRLRGIEREVRCGRIEVPENRDAPGGRTIAIHFAVVPALAKAKAADPVFVLAGGPGQSATALARQLLPVFAQINTRRDLVFVDQRGTGRSNPLACEAPARTAPLREVLDPQAGLARLRSCIARQDADLRQYGTFVAMQDLDAVRDALGHERINLWGASYGTRAALEYLRRYPARVRAAVLDGVAPADMRLPTSFAVDAEAALQQLLAACASDAACRSRHPRLEQDVDRLFARAAAGAPVTVAHPYTGAVETLRLDVATLSGLLRAPLYAPTLAAVLPHAIARAAAEEAAPLVALATALGGAAAEDFAELMHFAVICAEDMPLIDADALAQARRTRFGSGLFDLYRSACALLPKAFAPPEFYRLPAADVPVLMLSGGADPATPPRHAQAVARALPHSLHLVAPHLGHGVTAQGCAPELIARFIRQASLDGIDGTCLRTLPPPTFVAPPAGHRP